MEKVKSKCYNCKHSTKGFKVGYLTYHHCCDPEKYNQKTWDNGGFTAWDTLRVFSDTCKNHEFRNLEERMICIKLGEAFT